MCTGSWLGFLFSANKLDLGCWGSFLVMSILTMAAGVEVSVGALQDVPALPYFERMRAGSPAWWCPLDLLRRSGRRPRRCGFIVSKVPPLMADDHCGESTRLVLYRSQQAIQWLVTSPSSSSGSAGVDAAMESAATDDLGNTSRDLFVILFLFGGFLYVGRQLSSFWMYPILI